ncbi:MAG: diacylglycerol/lipid kinase family protein [Saprospiraceae bacterium]
MKDAHPYNKSAALADILRRQRVVFIVNPKAGTRMQRRIRESIEKHLDHRKFEHGIWFTEKAGHATELTRKAVADGCDIVVAVGGDGSINEVACGLIGTEAVLGIIPAGSGNGLAMHLGYGRSIDKAMQKLNTATPRSIDCGLLNGRPFFNIAGIGFDGLVSNLMQGRGKRGFANYFLKSVEAGLTYTAKPCTIETDGKTIEETCFTVSIANGPMYGYNFQIAPNARLDDGQFEVVILKDAPRWQYFAAAAATFKGNIYDAPFVEHFPATSVKIRCAGENFVHLDGEGTQIEGDLQFEIRRGALRVLVPAATSN